MPPSPLSSPWPVWGKALASQLIVWHHLVHYGPLPDALRERLPALMRWLDTQALMAVQVFLVISGYLAARSLWPAPGEPRVSVREWPARVGRRCARLLPVYVLALLAAALAAAVARAWMVDEDTPAAPTLAQVLAHAALLQDVVDQPALSAGVWYVAIDLQLFALLAALAALAGAAMRPRAGGTAGLVLVVAGVAASLLVFNLMPEGDMWAPYFFGAYGLGVLAAWGERRRVVVTALLLALVGAALLLEWRDRIALAGVAALVLLWQPGRAALSRSALQPLAAWLAKVSYAVFLLHYPVSLLASAAAMRWAPDDDAVHIAALVAVWLTSLGLGWLAWRTVETRLGSPRWPIRAAAH